MEDERETSEAVGMEIVAPTGPEAISDGMTMAPEPSGPAAPREEADRRASADEPADVNVTWRALPTLASGLARTLAAGGIGLLTGLVWGFGGRSAPTGFVAALGWALALGVVPLLAMAAGFAFDGDLRRSLARGGVRARTLQALAIYAVLILAMAAAVTVLPDTAALGIPTAYALVLGLGIGFGPGGMRLRRMTGDARWLFVGMGAIGLFGLALTFLVPAVLSPAENGTLGFYGCLLFGFGLPGAVAGAILGGWLHMRAEWAAFGMPPAIEEGFPLELDGDHWSRRPALAEPALATDDSSTEDYAMTAMTTDEVIETLTRQRQALLDSITGLSDEQLDRKGVVGDWSIKNALAHLVDWEVVVVRVTPERLRTRTKPAELAEINADEDGYNARAVASREPLTPQEQLVQFAEARARLIELVRGLGDETLARSNPWPEWQGTLGEYFIASVGEHEQEHAGAIAAGAEKLRGALASDGASD